MGVLSPSSIILLSLFLFYYVQANIYLHNPRGSNNRLSDGNTQRTTANRLFDSENNANGGYCWGPALSYIEGSVLPIEWTSNYGGANPSSSITTIIQYMCTGIGGENDIRDGTSTTRIQSSDDPNSGTLYYNYNISGNYYYGMHETFSYYDRCRRRQRNKGLFLSAGLSNNPTYGSMITRQNRNGDRSGFECSEERHPSPWKDIAVITDQPNNCAFYKSESQNVKAKYSCSGTTNEAMQANNAADCAAASGTWTATPAFGIPAPDCIQPSYFPQQGNLDQATRMQRYQWRVPSSTTESCVATGCSCVLRIRYNVTSVESNGLTGQFPDSLSVTPLTNTPTVNVSSIGELEIAILTDQTGRVFQDRSFVFHITPRPPIPSTSKVYNLNVRGKRGHDTEIYPATQYAFSPEKLDIEIGDYIHFQWTGCDTNSASFSGVGLYGTDRSNIVQIESLNHNTPINYTVTNALFPDPIVRKKMAYLGQTNCATQPTTQDDTNNCFVLNAAPAYFDGGIVRMANLGSFYYMSSRNNNFGNRFHKGSIIVHPVGNLPSSSSSSSTTTSSSTTSSNQGDNGSGASIIYSSWICLFVLIASFFF